MLVLRVRAGDGGRIGLDAAIYLCVPDATRNGQGSSALDS